MAWLDAAELSTKAVFETGPRPNGVAIVARRKLGIAACIGNETRGPELHALELSTGVRWSVRPGRPPTAARSFCQALRRAQVS
jgi:hypothetical protein